MKCGVFAREKEAGNDLVYVKFIVFEWHLIYNNIQLTPAEILQVKCITKKYTGICINTAVVYFFQIL